MAALKRITIGVEIETPALRRARSTLLVPRGAQRSVRARRAGDAPIRPLEPKRRKCTKAPATAHGLRAPPPAGRPSPSPPWRSRAGIAGVATMRSATHRRRERLARDLLFVRGRGTLGESRRGALLGGPVRARVESRLRPDGRHRTPRRGHRPPALHRVSSGLLALALAVGMVGSCPCALPAFSDACAGMSAQARAEAPCCAESARAAGLHAAPCCEGPARNDPRAVSPTIAPAGSPAASDSRPALLAAALVSAPIGGVRLPPPPRDAGPPVLRI
jgi:hypothetical protein